MTDKSLYERLGGTYGIAAAVDVLVEKLFTNEIINQNPAVEDFHKHEANKPGYKVLVTTWSIEKRADQNVTTDETCLRHIKALT